MWMIIIQTPMKSYLPNRKEKKLKKVGEEFISEIDKNRAIVRYLWRIVVVLSISLIVLAISFFYIKDTAIVKVELPGKLIYKYSPVVVAGIDGANDIYYKLWAKYIINKVANFKSVNVSKKINIIKKMMNPKTLALKEKKIDNFARSLTINLVDQDFKIDKVKIVSKKMKNNLVDEATLEVEGFAKQTVGKKYFNKSCKYNLKFEFLEGVLYVKNFGTDCF